ncbi:MAG: hypothetical protein MOB07_16220 [Acidobacteria bacterium]|nr:hypothetical protein [Acidobacteriota bacterium]
MTLSSSNPWRAEGVSILPDNPTDLLPLVGQEELFRRLESFRDEISRKGAHDLTGFFVIIGGWGVGKSRVGHEVCLEAGASDVEWIVDGHPQRLLQPSLKDGILPLFVRYSHVTGGQSGTNLEKDNWIASVAAEALRRLVAPQAAGASNKLVKNQDRLFDLARKALRPKGWDAVADQVRAALQNEGFDEAVRSSLAILKKLGVNHLLLVVDEIEDITDVDRDGLPSSDRQGIDQALLTVIPRVIKEEDLRQEFPQLNFLLLCSQAVGDAMKGIRAIERRTRWHELTTNSFSDVEAFFQYLRDHRPSVAEGIKNYPPGLKEAAFFAANRNFGWFNVIMYHAHENMRGGSLDVPELLHKFAKDPTKGHIGTVFDLEAISDLQVEADRDKEQVTRLLFGLLPKPIGENPGEIPPAAAERLFKKTHVGLNKPLFTRVREVVTPPRHLITAHLVNSGFRNPHGNTLELQEESARFDLKVVLESLEAYSIGLPAERRDHLLICEKEEEFIEQVRGLSPYASEAHLFASYLHHFLLSTQPTSDTGEGARESERRFLAPSFSFLLRFNRLNKQRKSEEGLLRDGVKNSQLKEAFTRLQGKQRIDTLLRGVAFAWERKPVNFDLIDGLKLPAASFTSSESPLNLGAEGRVTLLFFTSNAREADLEQDLTRLGALRAHPIIVLLENEEHQKIHLADRLSRIAPSVAPLVTVHNLNSHEFETLLHLGLMGEAFEETDFPTSNFIGRIEVARQRLAQALGLTGAGWQGQVERDGLVLRPIFHVKSAKEEELRALANGYVAMINGASYDQSLQSFLDETERDLLKKGIERHVDPSPKYAEHRTIELFSDESGTRVIEVPRALVTFMDRCGTIARSRSDLEKFFLFDSPPDILPRDIIRQLTSFLTYAGLLEVEADKYRRVTSQSLENALKRAEDWLDGEYERIAKEIRAVHQDVGDGLLNVWAKDARQRLKDARGKLSGLSLDFLSMGWRELEKDGSDGLPIYESRLRKALSVINEVKTATRWVFDPVAAQAFQYTSEALNDFEQQAARPDYPLWRRAILLRGFYRSVVERRQALLERIEALLDESDRRVPSSAAGEKIFPTQVLSLPLGLYHRELQFTAGEPQRTLSAAGTTLGTSTVGFKLASGKHREVLNRLDAIEADLSEPGKLALRYLECLKGWERLRQDYQSLAAGVAKAEQFFADAPADVRQQYGLASVTQRAEELRGIAEEGLMRDDTDRREMAGTPVFQMIDGLEDDLKKVKDWPGELRDRLEGIERGVLITLQTKYKDRYGALMSAFSRIRKAQNLEMAAWPEKRAATYQATVDLFEQVVQAAEAEGNAYLSDADNFKFQDLVALCEQELQGKQIDWNDPTLKRYVQTLIDKRLLVLKLI